MEENDAVWKERKEDRTIYNVSVTFHAYRVSILEAYSLFSLFFLFKLRNR